MSASGRRIALTVGACAVGLAAAPAVLAAPAPFAVQVGMFDPATFTDLQGFYPRNAVVHEGDTLSFTFVSPHTATFPRRGTKMPPVAVPAGGPTPATNDPGGTPYWFVGQPQFALNAAAFAPTRAKAVNGRQTVSSGFKAGGKFTVSFPRRGTYQVFCALHPKMRGKVTVLPKAAKAPSGAVQKRTAAAQLAADRKAAARVLKQAQRATAAAPEIRMPGTTRLAIDAFVPARRTVAPGTTLTWRMTGRNEIHTITFGPTAYVDGLQGRSFEGVPPGTPMSSEGFYPSDAPGTIPSLGPTTHGNGFVNSGVLTDPGIPGPKTFRVRFDTPGTYDYRCLVHPFMRGTITVA